MLLEVMADGLFIGYTPGGKNMIAPLVSEFTAVTILLKLVVLMAALFCGVTL
jgi:hypothetical protein